MNLEPTNKFIVLMVILAICSGLLFFTTAYAYAGVEAETEETEKLSVDAVWLENDTLHIAVSDTQTGVNQTLTLNFLEYADGSEFVSVQAVDRSGNKSNVIQFKNPYYQKGAKAETDTARTDGDDSEAPGESKGAADSNGEDAENSAPSAGNANPFTPDGTGTVMDDANGGDDKEFFTVKTEDGNVFYLIVDRQRTSENVYLLNAVSESDLVSLAKPDSVKPENAIPDGGTTQTPPAPESPDPPEETSAKPAAGNRGANSGSMIFIAIAALAVGGAGYYFKILRPKQAAADRDDADEYEDEDGFNEDGSDGESDEYDSDSGGDEE